MTTARANPATAVRAVSALDDPGVRILLLLPGAIALLAGLDAALMLLGLWSPVSTQRLAGLHGPLMVFGFIGTVVTLERAVALRKWWGFASPGLLGLGGIATLTPLDLWVGQAAIAGGCLALVGVYAGIWRRQAMPAIAIQALGGILGFLAALLWLRGIPIPELILPMSAFLILTITGERLELARVAIRTASAGAWAIAAAVGVAVGVIVALLWPAVGYPLFGLALIGQVVWLVRHDVAMKTIRARGLTRFMAACLLAGYFWLAIAGGSWLMLGQITSGRAYDGILHAVFLGFVMSMIMAHAPVILPAVLRRPLPYRPILYLPAALLQVSLILRVMVGDGENLPWAVQWGGGMNILAVLLFVGLAAGLVVRSGAASGAGRASAAKGAARKLSAEPRHNSSTGSSANLQTSPGVDPQTGHQVDPQTGHQADPSTDATS